MSACISRHGEFSNHEPTEEDPLTCRLCGVFDEEQARDRLAELEAKHVLVTGPVSSPFVKVLLEFDDQCILVGTGPLVGDITGTPWDLRMPGLPDLLRRLADQHESAITTGPDETTWLAGPT